MVRISSVYKLRMLILNCIDYGCGFKCLYIANADADIKILGFADAESFIFV